MFTVLVCCSASGVFLPPHVVYKGERLRLPWTQGFDGCTFGCTQSGWMEADQFAKWFEKTFVSHCSKLTGDKILFWTDIIHIFQLDYLTQLIEITFFYSN
jgi:hypothetical protein